jgi:hypothetical protein
LSTISSPKNRPSGRPFGREKRAEQAMNYPSQRIFQNKPPYGKDRQRYALNLTVYGFGWRAFQKRPSEIPSTYVAIDSSNLLDLFLIPFVVQSVMRSGRVTDDASPIIRTSF